MAVIDAKAISQMPNILTTSKLALIPDNPGAFTRILHGTSIILMFQLTNIPDV